MRYRHPPLVEAVYEVVASPTEWSPGPLEEALRSSYSGRREETRPVGLRFQVGPGLALQGVQREEQPERTRLWTPGGDRMVQFEPGMCALNVLPPYSHYLEYLPEFERLVDLYLTAAKPSGVALLGHRYINKVRLPDGGTPDGFFQIYPALPMRVREKHPPFSMQVEVETLAVGGSVVLTLTALGIEDSRAVYVLDIYARSQTQRPADWETIRAWHDAAHASVMAAFELAITNDARDLFGQEET